MRTPLFCLASILSLLPLSGFAMPDSTSEPLSPPTPHHAQAIVSPSSGSQVKGTVNFTEHPGGMEVQYHLSGLTPNSRHGFHIHEKGKCDDPQAKSAGKHYIELSGKDGTSLDFPHHYAGDLPEIVADSFGNANRTVLVPNLTMNKTNPIADRAIIIHGGPDDLTQKSSPRIACGVIRRAED